MNKNNVKILTDWSKFNYNEAWTNVYEKYYTVLKSEAEKENEYSFIRFEKVYNSIDEMLEDLKKFTYQRKESVTDMILTHFSEAMK